MSHGGGVKHEEPSHVLSCNEHHRHEAPKCCSMSCWCRKPPAALQDLPPEVRDRLLRRPTTEDQIEAARRLMREPITEAESRRQLEALLHPPRYDIAYHILVWELLKLMSSGASLGEPLPQKLVLKAMAKAAGELA